MGLEQLHFWMWISISALVIMFILLISPSSTAVDRVALYWIPLQLVVWSNAPNAFLKPGQSITGWVLIVIFYSAMVQFTWLFFATHASHWLPYKFYPWEALWR